METRKSASFCGSVGVGFGTRVRRLGRRAAFEAHRTLGSFMAAAMVGATFGASSVSVCKRRKNTYNPLRGNGTRLSTVSGLSSKADPIPISPPDGDFTNR